jgi:hypothetical protein
MKQVKLTRVAVRDLAWAMDLAAEAPGCPHKFRYAILKTMDGLRDELKKTEAAFAPPAEGASEEERKAHTEALDAHMKEEVEVALYQVGLDVMGDVRLTRLPAYIEKLNADRWAGLSGDALAATRESTLGALNLMVTRALMPLVVE